MQIKVKQPLFNAIASLKTDNNGLKTGKKRANTVRCKDFLLEFKRRHITYGKFKTKASKAFHSWRETQK